MSLAGLLYDSGGRLRAPWRLAIFFAVLVLALILVLWLGAPVLALEAPVLSGSAAVLSGLLVLALVAAHAVTLRWVDRRPWSYVALHPPAARPSLLLRATFLGAIAIGVPVALLVAGSLLRVEPAPPGSSLMQAARLAAIFAPAALFEELLVRGYPFAVLREVWGWPAAILVTSVAFGLLHYRNPGADARSLAIVTLAGIFLGGILVVTGSLYAAWAAHFGWNWVLGAVLHASVSGLPAEAPDYRVAEAGPDWLTGGAWGPEGGAAAAAGMLGGLLLLFGSRRRLFPREAYPGPSGERESPARSAGREDG